MVKKAAKRAARAAAKALPRQVRFALYRSMVKTPGDDPAVTLKIAETREELEGCFSLLHDSYVGNGYMKPHPSGLRVTPWHALPTTTTLCALFQGRVVGTVSIVREGVFGLPMGSSFDLASVRAKGGNIAEISSLAVCRSWRGTSGAVLFPLMKFLYGYCASMFDTRHLAIVVNPERIELYEALLDFQRLPAGGLASYGFANGAPAVAAALDLATADAQLRRLYAKAGPGSDLRAYMVEAVRPSIQYPSRRYSVTNDPVMSPPLLDEFCVRRTGMAAELDPRRLALLCSIYDSPRYRWVLPAPDRAMLAGVGLRRHPRFSLRCKAHAYGDGSHWSMEVVEVFLSGFSARACHGSAPPPAGFEGAVRVELGSKEDAYVRGRMLRRMDLAGGVRMDFVIDSCDGQWRECVAVLETACARSDALPGGAWCGPRMG